jgi:hypothetical protein
MCAGGWLLPQHMCLGTRHEDVLPVPRCSDLIFPAAAPSSSVLGSSSAYAS